MNSLSYLLNKWQADPTVGGNISFEKIIPAQRAKYETIPETIHPRIIATLNHLGIFKLYSHQVESWNNLKEGNNIVIVTGTASGKSLCYNLSVLDNLLRNPDSSALYLFPTKALAHDQLSILKNLSKLIDNIDLNEIDYNLISPATYDGDTPTGSRWKIRKKSRLILSNPDMLHSSILPNHTRWGGFFRGLSFIILDEIHTYRGVFGSHVANIIRRLKRVTRFYGSTVQFILTSATIGNPIELAQKIIDDEVIPIDNDGSASGEKHFLIYNPPIINHDLGLRAPLLQEAVRISEDVLSHRMQVIIFGRSRRSVEIILTYLRSKIGFENEDISSYKGNSIRAYRSGYLPKQRREIEEGLRLGVVRGVIATTALELGIDIGSLEASILVGYPGTISGTWQQVGRVGRGEKPSLAILITSPSPLDQYISKNPEYIFAGYPEEVRINPDNLLLLLDHIRCAAFELPFQAGDSYSNLDSDQTLELLEILQAMGDLYKSSDTFYWMADRFPASEVSLRNASKNRYTLQNIAYPNKTIGEVDGESAFWMVHPQAVYIHEGISYVVQDLDIDNHIAYIEPINVDYFTRSRQESEVQILSNENQKLVTAGLIGYGDIIITTQVVGYSKVKWDTHEKLGYYELTLPSSELNTTAYWFMMDGSVVEELRNKKMWSNDQNNYGPFWKTQRDLARARDKFICQVCGIPETETLHHVHHIIPFRVFDSINEANALSNLTTLCPMCHNRVETSVRIRSGLTGLGYILWNLTPLFLMCDVRDIGVHNDPKSSLNEGNPIIVIYDSIPGGAGFSQYLYEKHENLITAAYELASSCECSDGCPSCVGPGGEFGIGGKKETLAILRLITKKNQLRIG